MNTSDNNIILNQIYNHLKEDALSVKDPGLLYGRMGIAISFFEYARSTGNETDEDFAMEIVDSILNEINENTPPGYASGLAGIGVGIEYLIQHNFINADANDVFPEIDNMINNIIHFRSMQNAGLETGVCGIGHYLVHRIKGQAESKQELYQTLQNKEYIIYLIDWLEELIPSSAEYLNDILKLLTEVWKLNIYNTKVEKLILYCMEKIQDNNSGLKNGRAGTGFSLLTSPILW